MSTHKITQLFTNVRSKGNLVTMTLHADDESTREVYARFGLAYYMTECVHRELVNVFAMLPFSSQNAAWPRIEERLKDAGRMTLGELVTNTKSMVPTELHSSLEWALATRNWLAHGFWFDRIHMMTNEDDRLHLIDELTQFADMLHELNIILGNMSFHHLQSIGMTEDAWAEAIRECSQNPPEIPHQRQIPRTNELVEFTDAWMERRGARSTLILRDSAGDLWQLCDAGLGWCYRTAPADDWKAFPPLQEFLPAKINVRPKGAKPWQYKLHVSTGALLCVEWDDVGRIYKWRVEHSPTNRA